MGDQNEGGASQTVEIEDHVDDVSGRVGVEISGRLVGQQETRAIDEGPSEGHPLLLAAAQLCRVVVLAIPEANLTEEIAPPVERVPGTCQFSRHENVLKGRQCGQQLEILKDEPHVFIAKPRPGILIQVPKRGARQDHLTARWTVESSTQPQQGGLAAATRTDDGEGVPGREIKPNLSEDRELGARSAIGLGETAGDEDRIDHDPDAATAPRIVNAGFA